MAGMFTTVYREPDEQSLLVSFGYMTMITLRFFQELYANSTWPITPPETPDAQLELTATPPATCTCRCSLDLDFSETKVC